MVYVVGLGAFASRIAVRLARLWRSALQRAFSALRRSDCFNCVAWPGASSARKSYRALNLNHKRMQPSMAEASADQQDMRLRAVILFRRCVPKVK